MSGAISRRQSEIAALHVVRNFRTKGVDRLSPFEYNERMSNRYRYLTADVSWSDEKNAGPVSRETVRARTAQLHELIGQPFCDGCKSWECACACSECGKRSQALIGTACIACDDARTVAA
jgi:hypothetical protein